MDHQTADIADVGDVAVQLERFDKGFPGVKTTLENERRNGAVAPAAEEFGGPFVPGAVGQAGVVDRFDLVAVGEVLGDLLRRLDVTSIRRLRVSRPWRNMKELNGVVAAPRSRRI